MTIDAEADAAGDTSEIPLWMSGGMSVAAINFSVQAATVESIAVRPGRLHYFNVRNLDPAPGVAYPATVEILWSR